jgi:hypothetical protein
MGADWRNYCRKSNFDIEGNTVLVSLPGSRVHRVSIHDEDDQYRLVSIVTRAAVIAEIEALPFGDATATPISWDSRLMPGDD